MSATDRQLQLIAHTAARLMAEDGVADFTVAKRKAAQTLGLPENAKLPGNAEIEAQLRAYQRIFQNDEQHRRLDRLRRAAREVMSLLTGFNPYLADVCGFAEQVAMRRLLFFMAAPQVNCEKILGKIR